ncbi:uncharacterized protein V1518DRAFT_189766 [Limtongia smithiae]|uniref:uncharacterized protein n=1 Tax=Limtongia smithiae TaxID=1125753 RepID=UPI0034CE1453
MLQALAYFATSSLSRRAAYASSGDEPGQDPTYTLTPLTWGVIGLVTLAFVPLFVQTLYTLASVYPTLAMVEDPTSAPYEAVPSDDNGATFAAADETGDAVVQGSKVPSPITASILRTHRYLRSVNGRWADFRGLLVAITRFVLVMIIITVVKLVPFVPMAMCNLIAQLAVVQFSTAWVHVVMDADPRSVSLRHSLTPFRRTFKATCLPVFFRWLASSIVGLLAMLLARMMHIDGHTDNFLYDLESFSHSMIWKKTIVSIVTLVGTFVVVVPTDVVLTRVQASLLPADAKTVVPFDRSFEGTVKPAVVDGLDYVSMLDAFRTFSRASWRRLLMLYVNVFLLTVVVEVAYIIILALTIVMTNKPSPAV